VSTLADHPGGLTTIDAAVCAGSSTLTQAPENHVGAPQRYSGPGGTQIVHLAQYPVGAGPVGVGRLGRCW